MPDKCERCGDASGVVTMSRFNTDVICLPCKEDEEGAPGYMTAMAAEDTAILAGNYNFPGVGLSEADQEYLNQRLKERNQAE